MGLVYRLKEMAKVLNTEIIIAFSQLRTSGILFNFQWDSNIEDKGIRQNHLISGSRNTSKLCGWVNAVSVMLIRKSQKGE